LRHKGFIQVLELTQIGLIGIFVAGFDRDIVSFKEAEVPVCQYLYEEELPNARGNMSFEEFLAGINVVKGPVSALHGSQ